MARLRLGFYPYTYARVSVMRTMLLSREQWEGLLKMGPNEIIRYLQDKGYTDLPQIKSSSLAAIEMALNNSLMHTLLKLKRISDEKMKEVLEVYTFRYDLENIKIILRGKHAKVSDEELKMLVMPSINYPKDYYVSLIEKNVAQLEEELELEGSPVQMENQLDNGYYDRLFGLSRRLAGQGKVLREFLNAELDILNIKLIIRLKNEKENSGQIKAQLIHPAPALLKLAELDLNGIIRQLKRLGYVDIKGDEEDLLAVVEGDLDHTLLQKESLLMHQHPLTVNVILGFMFAKEIEIKNLKILLKGKHLGIDMNRLQKLLVI